MSLVKNIATLEINARKKGLGVKGGCNPQLPHTHSVNRVSLGRYMLICHALINNILRYSRYHSQCPYVTGFLMRSPS